MIVSQVTVTHVGTNEVSRWYYRSRLQSAVRKPLFGGPCMVVFRSISG